MKQPSRKCKYSASVGISCCIAVGFCFMDGVKTSCSFCCPTPATDQEESRMGKSMCYKLEKKLLVELDLRRVCPSLAETNYLAQEQKLEYKTA
jgi:hypothetical protein